MNRATITRLDENPSTAVERTLAILEAVAQRHGGMSNADISRRLEIPKSSASYILRALEKHGYLRRDPDTNKYRLGVKILSLSRGALTGIDVREVALPFLRHLVDHSQLTAHLAILDGDEAVYIEKVDSPGFIKMDTWVGKRCEVHTTSVGKALAAHAGDERIHEIAKSRGLRRVTSHTITGISRLMTDFEKIRELGYALDDEENSVGVRCLAAPIFDQNGRVEASIGVSGTTGQVTVDAIPRIAEMVKDAARRISTQLGYRAQRA